MYVYLSTLTDVLVILEIKCGDLNEPYACLTPKPNNRVFKKSAFMKKAVRQHVH